MNDNNRRMVLQELVKSSESYRSPNHILQTKYAESYASHFMEQVQYQSPLKSDSNKENVLASPMQWMSPVTPPPSFTSLKTPRKNPFDANLTENLHLETFSPSVFSQVMSPSDEQDPNWRIEHVALLNPTDFSPNFHNHLPDPTTEAEAQEKILQFFSQKQIAPSPWSMPRSRMMTRSKAKVPHEAFPLTTSTKSTWTQTAMSFPPFLPPDVEELLSRYMNEPQESAGHSPPRPSDADDSGLLNASSLRRKLFTHAGSTPTRDECDTTPASDESADISQRHTPTVGIRCRDRSSSPVLLTGPLSRRFSFSPCSRPVSPPVLSPICSRDETSMTVDETTRQSWMIVGDDLSGLQNSGSPEGTVLMEAGETSCCVPFSLSGLARNRLIKDDGYVGKPVECSTPTKSRPGPVSF